MDHKRVSFLIPYRDPGRGSTTLRREDGPGTGDFTLTEIEIRVVCLLYYEDRPGTSVSSSTVWNIWNPDSGTITL